MPSSVKVVAIYDDEYIWFGMSMIIDWRVSYYQAEEAQSIYGVFLSNTFVTVFWVHLYDKTYFPRNTGKKEALA